MTIHGKVCPWLPLEFDPAAEKTLSQINEWITKCDKTHANCNLPDGCLQSNTTNLPSRVLDVGSPDESKDPILFITADGLDDRCDGQYIALTHRWPQPGEKMLTTTIATLSERKRGIPMELLPKTFQDAVLITRKLGKRYLWIDSLCILQDSREDWETEAGLMHLVYRDAFLTISADAGTQGCLVPRDPLTIRPCNIELLFKEPNVYIMPHPFNGFHDSIDSGPLSMRGKSGTPIFYRCTDIDSTSRLDCTGTSLIPPDSSFLTKRSVLGMCDNDCFRTSAITPGEEF